MSGSKDCLAIVVIGRNEGERLRDCIRSALNACPNVIYADSASTDDSVELANSMGAFVVSVDSAKPLNAARGRNAGLSAVNQSFPECQFIQFIDGDCLLVAGWTKVALDFLKSHPQAAVACGRRFEAHPDASLYNQLADDEWNTPLGLTSACGGDAMMRVSALDEVGGFNSALMASEEPELTARMRELGWEIWRLDAKMTEHDARILTFSQWWRRTTRSGYGYAQAWLSTRKLPQPINRRLLLSAVLWVIAIPAVVSFLAILCHRGEVVILLPSIYFAQILRLALRRPKLSFEGFRASSMVMIAKLPELIGAARALASRHRSAVIEYKNVGATSSRRTS